MKADLEKYLDSKGYKDYGNNGVFQKDFEVGEKLKRDPRNKVYKVEFKHIVDICDSSFRTRFYLRFRTIEGSVPIAVEYYPAFIVDQFKYVLKKIAGYGKESYVLETGRDYFTKSEDLKYTQENVDKHIYKMIESELDKILRWANDAIKPPRRKGRM